MSFDNFTFTPVQPYESAITYFANNGGAAVKVTGNRGEEIPEYIPENNGLKFLGWYTDKDLTVPFTYTTFPRVSANLYAKWAGVAFDFNNYTPSTNTGVFATQCMSIDKSEGAGYADDTALVWHYKGDAYWKEGEVIADRGTGGRDFKAILGTVENNTTYTITYYVKTEYADSSYRVLFSTGHPAGLWEAGYVSYADSSCYVDKSTVGEGWIKKTTIITTNFGTEKASNLYVNFNIDNPKKEHENIVYLDRIIVTKVEDNAVIFRSGSDDDSVYQIGKKGDALNFPTFTNGKAEFLGWYSDSTYQVPFTSTVMPEGITVVYAKWSAVPIGFDKYKYASSNRFEFGVSMSVVEKQGIGVDDNFALQWHVDSEMVRNVNADGSVVYMKDRAATGQDNIARLGNLEDKTAYKITYYYRAVEGSNCDAKIFFATCHEANIWDSNYVGYSYTTQSVPLKQTSWQKAEVYLVTDFADAKGKMLYIQVVADVDSVSKIPANIDATVLVDNVFVEKIAKPYVVFDGQNKTAIKVVGGAPGSKIAYPSNPIKNGFDFDGWYLDKEFTQPFTKTTFAENESYIVYAKYKRSAVVNYDFENYGINAVPGWNLFGNGITIGEAEVAYSGNKAVRLDRSEVQPSRLSHFIVAGDGIKY